MSFSHTLYRTVWQNFIFACGILVYDNKKVNCFVGKVQYLHILTDLKKTFCEFVRLTMLDVE